MLTKLRSAGRSSRMIIWLLIFIAFVIGFLLYDASGLVSGGGITTSTKVATVNGRDVLYTQWAQVRQNAIDEESQRLGRSLTLDEMQQIEDRAFDRMVADILLDQEVRRRGITASDDEIRQYANFQPPPWLQQRPELYTEGRFDFEKYRRYLGSPAVQQSGELMAIEQYYRGELPKLKLYDQIASSVYLTDSRLWRMWRDEHDSASVSFVVLPASLVTDSAVQVSDDEIRAFYGEHEEQFERQGRAVVTVLALRRQVTAADSAAARQRAETLRAEIVGGADFADVARRESADSASGAQGGDLGRGARGRFVEEFESAAYALGPGQISQPVLTDFGYHLIRVDERKGDTLALRHILVEVRQSDSAAVAVDRRADSLANVAAERTERAALDSAGRLLGLTPRQAEVREGQPLFIDGQYVPSVSAWAFSGAAEGETSELFDAEDGYFVARLDTLEEGGTATLEDVREDIRAYLARRKKVEQLRPRADSIARVVAGSSLEQAAQQMGLAVQRSPMFTRTGLVPGLGRLNEAIGAAFALPVGAVSEPVATDDGIFILRVERRVNADRAAWEAQKQMQRAQLTEQLRRQRIEEFVANLRRSADVEDRRREVNAAARRVEG